MKKVYFVQVGFEFDGSVYLPYGVGTIIAYCLSKENIKTEYEFPDIIFQREKLCKAVDKINNPFIVAFSCSVWNTEYNKALAVKIKEKYPDCITVFGGHSATAELLKEDFADFVMFGEGEETFAELLENLDCGDYTTVHNIAYKHNGKIIVTPKDHSKPIDNYPSPYLTGVFDKLLKDNKELDFLAVLETNRGCPYDCAYCDWCADKKVRFFPMDKILNEINWLSENKIAYCFCADSNFGMFERDYDISLALVNAKKATGYPQVFRPCYEKNSAERVFRICSTLNSVGMDKGATMAYQTLSDKALENIGRKNLTMEHFSGLMNQYNEAGIPTYSELILGLPGETKESFCKGICRLFENGQHNSVSVYHCEVLPNALLAQSDYIRKHKIEVMKVAFNHIHSAPEKEQEIKEYSYLVRSTATLSRDDWVYSNLFSVCVQCFHSLGLLRFFAIFLRTEMSLPYYEFYTSLLDYILCNTNKLSALWHGFKNKYDASLAGDWNYYNKDFGNVTWFFEEGAFLEIVANYEEYFNELKPFLESFKIDKDIFNELIIYQKAIIRKPSEKNEEIAFDYNFYSYFRNILQGNAPLFEKKKNYMKIHSQTKFDSLPSYAKECVWFGRRRGSTIYNSNEIIITD